MADNPRERRFNINSWVVNIGITVVVIASMVAMCQGAEVNAQNTTDTAPAPTPATSQPSTEQTPTISAPQQITPNQNTGQLNQSAPLNTNPQSPPNPQFNAPNQFDQRQQLGTDPYDQQNRQLQLEERQQLRQDRQQLRQDRRQLNTNPYEQESRQIQRDEREQFRRQTDNFGNINNLDILDEPEQLDIIRYGDTSPYEVVLYSQFLLLDYPDAFNNTIPAYPYVADGIRHLSDALFVLSEQNDAIPNSRAQIHTQLNQLADQLQQDSTDLNAPELTSDAFVQTADWMQDISTNTFPFANATNEIRDVQEAAQRIDTFRPLTDQQYEVRRFFQLAEIAVHTLSQQPNSEN